MSYFNDTTMISGSTVDTITLEGSSPAPVYTISQSQSSNITSIANSGLYWGNLNGSSSGQVYTTNGTSNGWANITLAEPDIKGATLKVNGNADFDGEVTIKGKSLTDMFEKIEERLAILHPNEKLEEKWDELKELGKRYKELEAEIIEKEKVWAILKR
jgi:hypothetical protein